VNAQGETSRPVSRVARQLALAHAVESLVEGGELKDYAAAARLLRLTRARLTQVMNLLGLSPRLQDAILAGEVTVNERHLRSFVGETEWARQEALFKPASLLGIR
jgi:hypothetical protein